MSQFERQVEDLKTAQRKMSEAVSNNNIVKPLGDDTVLSRYRDADGGLVLKSKSVKVEVDGRGSMTGTQEGLLDAAVPPTSTLLFLVFSAKRRIPSNKRL